MHSSWLFPGASSGPRQTVDAAAGDRSNNSNGASFEINSFVRSLKLHGVQLPGGFPFKGVTNSNNNNKREWNDPNAGKSLNELLSVLNDSVDRIVECGPQDRSSTSSFGSFPSGIEERDPASLNDLIYLVSTTANDLRDINAGNARAESSARNLHLATSPVNPLDIGTRTLAHPEIKIKKDGEPFNISAPKSATQKRNNSRENSRASLATESNFGSIPRKRRNPKGINFNDTRTTHEFLTTPELAEIYSEYPGEKGADHSGESPETRRYFETPTCFLPEVLRLAKTAGFADASSAVRDRKRSYWTPRNKRINFEDELWPISPGVNNNKTFSPYFTGPPSKAFQLRTAEKNVINDTKINMNSSRSSPIFTGGGEAPAESLEIVVPTRDQEDSLKELETRDIVAESNRDRVIPISIGTIGIPVEENLFDAPPTKLNKRDIDLNNSIIEEGTQTPQAVDINISLNISKEQDGVVAAGTNEDKIKRKACVKVLTKRHRKLGKQSKKIGWKTNSVKSDDGDTSEENLSPTLQSPITSARKTPIQRFLEESGAIGSDEEKLMGSVKGDDDCVETQMGVCTKTRRPNIHFNAKQLEAKSLKMVVTAKNKLPVRYNVLTEYQKPPKASCKRSTSVETNQSIASSTKLGNLKNIHQICRSNYSAQPIWKPAGSVKVEPSTSSSSVPRQSKIAQLTPRIRPNTTETVNKHKENTDAISKSKVPVVRKNQSQDIIAEKSRGQSLARKSEATVKIPRSKSKQRPGTPKKCGTSEYGRSDVKSVTQDRNSRPLSSRYEINKLTKVTDSNSKITIPVIRSKTFVYQIRRKQNVRRVVSKEDYVTDSKSISIGNSENPMTCGPVKQLFRKSPKDRSTVTEEVDLCSDTNAEDTPFDSQINTDAEQSYTDLQTISQSNFDKICAVEFSSNDSIEVKRIASKVSHTRLEPSLSSDENANGRNTREEKEEARERSSRSKFHNRHAGSLRMLKNILSHQGVSVEGVTKGVKEIRSKILSGSAKKSKIPSTALKKSPPVLGINQNNTESLVSSKTLFEKLAVLTETAPDRREPERRDLCEQSVTSLVEYGSESATSYARSMRDAEEQCCLNYESSVVSQTSVCSEKSNESRTLRETTTRVSNVFTEIDDDYRRNIYVDAAVSPTSSQTEESTKSFEAAVTQTCLKVLDKDIATEKIIQPLPNCNVCTETPLISFTSKDANTDFKGPDNVDATSQIDPTVNSRNTASGSDFSGIQYRSSNVNTERPDLFLKSRGVCVRGPRKIDGASQFDPPEKSKNIASGKDYVETQSVSEYVNTDRQDYLFEDRSVDVLAPATAEEACQIDPPPLEIVNAAVGEFSLDVKSSSDVNFRPKVPHDLHKIEAVIVKDVDIVQWQSSTTFNTSKINCGSSCSSTSSLVTWQSKYSQKSSAEKLQPLRDRVPKEAIAALEMANERAQNLYKAIGIYRETLATKKVNEPISQSNKSVENDKSPINVRNDLRSVAESKKICSFRENSKIKSLLEANLEKLHPEMSNTPSEIPEKNTESLKLQKEIRNLMDNLLTNVVQVIKSESEYCVCGDIDKRYLDEVHFVKQKKRQSPIKLAEILKKRNINEEKLQSTNKTLEFAFFSRNSLLTVIYGTVCSLVFWALQFSITCDSV